MPRLFQTRGPARKRYDGRVSLPAKDDYVQRIRVHQDRITRLDRLTAWLANARLLAFLLGIWIAWQAWGKKTIAPDWIFAPLVLFCVGVVLYVRLSRQRERARRLVRFHQRGVDRLENRWMGVGADGARFLDPTHPYAQDLDLFGKGSLFQKICRARTAIGEKTLARWLCEPSAIPEILERQQAIALSATARFYASFAAWRAASAGTRTAGPLGERLPWRTFPPCVGPRGPLLLSSDLCAGSLGFWPPTRSFSCSGGRFFEIGTARAYAGSSRGSTARSRASYWKPSHGSNRNPPLAYLLTGSLKTEGSRLAPDRSLKQRVAARFPAERASRRSRCSVLEHEPRALPGSGASDGTALPAGWTRSEDSRRWLPWRTTRMSALRTRFPTWSNRDRIRGEDRSLIPAEKRSRTIEVGCSCDCSS